METYIERPRNRYLLIGLAAIAALIGLLSAVNNPESPLEEPSGTPNATKILSLEVPKTPLATHDQPLSSAALSNTPINEPPSSALERSVGVEPIPDGETPATSAPPSEPAFRPETAPSKPLSLEIPSFPVEIPDAPLESGLASETIDPALPKTPSFEGPVELQIPSAPIIAAPHPSPSAPSLEIPRPKLLGKGL